jgi:hypothetical protein
MSCLREIMAARSARLERRQGSGIPAQLVRAGVEMGQLPAAMADADGIVGRVVRRAANDIRAQTTWEERGHSLWHTTGP